MYQEHLKKLFFTALVIFSVIIFFLKLNSIPDSGYASYDGAFYSDIALHVYNGDGLLTSNSSFDQFYKVLPRKPHVYPLWPFMGGILAHLFPESVKFVIKLEIINLIFSIFSIYVLYFLILNLLKKEGNKKYTYAFIFTVAFNSMATYYYYSIKPYTESLAIFMILSSLLVFFNILDYYKKKSNVFMSFILGVLLFLSFLARSQSSIFIFVIFLFSVYFLMSKKISKKSFFITWITSLILLISYFYYFYMIRAEHFELSSFFIFQNNYDYSNYPPLKHISENSFLVRFVSGIKGFFAFAYTGGVKNSGILVYILPVALIKFREYDIKLKLIIMTGALYLFSLLPMEMSFKANSSITLKWLFGHRHGILIMFLTLFSFLGLISYLNKKYKDHHNLILISTVLILSIASFSSFFVSEKLFPRRYNNVTFSISFMEKVYAYLRNENKYLNNKMKIISLNSRNISLNSRALGYSFESRRENWKEYLIYKMKKLNIDYFIINKYYDYYKKDVKNKKDDYFKIMKNKTPKEFKLVKSFKDDKTGNWIGIYSLK